MNQPHSPAHPHAHPHAAHPHANGAHPHAPHAHGLPVGPPVSVPVDPDSIMGRLRTETLGHHQRAENHPWQRTMAKGRLTARQYAMWLGQMRHVHKALESALDQAKPANPHIAAVVDPIQYQIPHVDADLIYYGGDPLAGTVLPSVKAAVDTIERTATTDPTRLLGLHYVIEGSKNGGRYIVRGLRRAYNLTPGQGDRSMDPYGEQQPAEWAKFKTNMTARNFDTPTCDAIIASAGDMFDAFYAVSEDLAKHENLKDEA